MRAGRSLREESERQKGEPGKQKAMQEKCGEFKKLPSTKKRLLKREL
jgi:hypothetical protein